MKRKILFICLVSLVGSFTLSWPAMAEWKSLSAGLPETDIRWVAADPGNSDTLYAASRRHLYKTTDNGDSWKNIFSLQKFSSAIQAVYFDPSESGCVYVAADNGVWRSADSGKKWNLFYRGTGGASKNVFFIAASPGEHREIWLGTAAGLVAVDSGSKEARKISSFPNIAAHSILSDADLDGKILVLAADGIYQSEDKGIRWQRVLTNPAPTSNEDRLQAVGVEETPMTALSTNIIRQPAMDKWIAITPRGIYEAASKNLSWQPVNGGGAAGGAIHYLTASPASFYVATNRGVYRWDLSRSGFEDISEGLGSREVFMIFYDELRDRLLAATQKGMFEYEHPDPPAPELRLPDTDPRRANKKEFTHASAEVRDALKIFEREPGIALIQKAAIEYAEVHPRKIQEWRHAAQKKAWLPTVSLSQKINHDRNVDIDRGGTGDPDRFIEGPQESSSDWSLGMSWDLGDLVWNDDQTSIDTRSKLMAELRDDVLNEVTHLFYERRRLQVEMAFHSAVRLQERIKQELRLEEFTANIDGLTGGYLSTFLASTTQAPTEYPHI